MSHRSTHLERPTRTANPRECVAAAQITLRIAQVAQRELTPGVGLDAEATNERGTRADQDHPDVVLADPGAPRGASHNSCPRDYLARRVEPAMIARHGANRTQRIPLHLTRRELLGLRAWRGSGRSVSWRIKPACR